MAAASRKQWQLGHVRGCSAEFIQRMDGCMAAALCKKSAWPQPNSWDHYTQWQHQQWPHGWSQPQWNTWEVNHTFYQQQKAAAESWGPLTKGEYHQDSGAAASSGSTAVATETSPADVLQAQEQSAYWDDVQFLEKHEQKDRQRRRAHRWNLKERRWEAAERIAMLENDVTRCRPIKRTLSAQVMHFAQRKETETVTKLSESLPKTPQPGPISNRPLMMSKLKQMTSRSCRLNLPLKK